ncbi:MAG: Sec-independent protein translocase protein TatB [Xanthobacteraceae bacterium]
MFDISWGKLVIIGVVALLVIGPKELPAVLRQLGQWMTKIRRMAAEFQGQFQDAMREAEMADLKKQFDDTTSSIKSTFDTTEIKNELEKMIQDPAAVSTPPSSTATAPASDLPAPAQQTAAAATDPVALGTAPVAPPAAELSVPMLELPPPPETKDFVDASTAPAAPAPAPTPSEPKPVAAPEGGKAA